MRWYADGRDPHGAWARGTLSETQNRRSQRSLAEMTGDMAKGQRIVITRHKTDFPSNGKITGSKPAGVDSKRVM